MIDNSVSSLHYNSKTKNSTSKTAATLSVDSEPGKFVLETVRRVD